MKILGKITLIIALAFTVLAAQWAFVTPMEAQSTAETFGLASGVASERTDETLEDVKIFSDATLTDDFADDRVTVVLTRAATRRFLTYGPEDFSEIGCVGVEELTQHTVKWVEAQLSDNPEKPKESMMVDVQKYKRIFSLTLANESKENVLTAVKKLEWRGDILAANPSFFEAEQLCASPNPNEIDTTLDSQWGLEAIQASEAWAISTGTNVIKVGVLDTGIDTTHPDLSNRICRENLHCNLWYPTYDMSKTSVGYYDQHGTLVSGIICGENNSGISGVFEHVSLVSLRCFDNNGGGNPDWTVRGIDYAASKEIPILNFSAGSTMYNAGLHYSIAQYTGLFVCAAGNLNDDIDNPGNSGTNSWYPAVLPLKNVISVGATTLEENVGERRAMEGDYGWTSNPWMKGSNYGARGVDLFAPGTGVVSTYPKEIVKTGSWTKCSNGTCDLSTHVDIGYHWASGTSMAAPYVTAVAAMILSEYPHFSAFQIRKAIMDGVDVLPLLENDPVVGRTCVTGGRLNAYGALLAAEQIHIANSYEVDNDLYFEIPDIEVAGDGFAEVYITFPSGSAYQSQARINFFSTSDELSAELLEPGSSWAPPINCYMFYPQPDEIYRVRILSESASTQSAKLTVVNRPQGGYYNYPHIVDDGGSFPFYGWSDGANSWNPPTSMAMYFTPGVTKSHIFHFKPDAFAFAPTVYVSNVKSGAQADVYQSNFGGKECFIAGNLEQGETYFIVVSAKLYNPNYPGMMFSVEPITVGTDALTATSCGGISYGTAFHVTKFTSTGSKTVTVPGQTPGMGGYVKVYENGQFVRCVLINSATMNVSLSASSTSAEYTICVWYP